MRKQLSLVAVAVLALAAQSAMAGLAGQYTLKTFGVVDAFHTYAGTSSNLLSTAQTTYPPGPPLAGFADAYQDGYTVGRIPGRTAWAYDGTTLTPIGFSSGAYLQSDNYTYSTPAGQTASGAISGSSLSFSDLTQTGQDSWVYSGGSTTPIGVFSGHTYTLPSASPASNLITGYARNTSGVAPTTDTYAWVYDGTSSTQLGYYDATHTASNSTHKSFAGTGVGNYVRGYSTRYAGGTTSVGQSAWIYDDGAHTTTRAGYTGGSYTSGSNEYSSVASINAGGVATGYSSYSYDSTNQYFTGKTAWVRSANGTMTALSLAGPQYLNPSGVRDERGIAVNASGQVAGISYSNWLASSSSFTTSDAWLYSQGSNQVLAAPATTFTFGYGTRMVPTLLNNNGDVSGLLGRVLAGSSASSGSLPFVFHNGVVTQTGIFDAAHTGTGGKTSQMVSLLGDGGVAAGTASRYDATGSLSGNDTWIFDPQAGATVALSLSNDSAGSTSPLFVTPDGWVGGFFDYQLSPSSSTWSAFLWSHDTGLVDFNSLFVGGLASQGINRVTLINWVSPGGDVYATATMTDGSISPVIFQAAVPEPGALSLLAGFALLGLRRRARATH